MSQKTKIVVVIVLLIILGYLIFDNQEKIFPKKEIIPAPIVETESRELCFYLSPEEKLGYDKAWLEMKIQGEKITGEFKNYPNMKDSKVGSLEGVVGPVDPNIMGRTANVWWDSLAEGMQIKEELQIEFGDGSAVVFFGEMTDRGDGVFLYKDKNKIIPGSTLTQIDCQLMQEMENVEKYVRENISALSPEGAVLGGNWYMLDILVNSTLNSGEVVFEDGHIQKKGIFEYDYQSNVLKITKFEIKN